MCAQHVIERLIVFFSVIKDIPSCCIQKEDLSLVTTASLGKYPIIERTIEQCVIIKND